MQTSVKTLQVFIQTINGVHKLYIPAAMFVTHLVFRLCSADKISIKVHFLYSGAQFVCTCVK